MSFQRQLRVVLLKDLIVRMRKYISTTIELFSPILLFLLVFVFRDFLIGKPLDMEAETYARTPVFALQHSRIDGMKIYYAPFRPALDNIMRRAAENLFVYETDVKAFYNETELLRDMDSPKIAVVVFQNITSDELPKQLKYQIRLLNDFNLAVIKPNVLTAGPHEAYGITYETFVELQAAIDKAYLDLKSGQMMPEMSVQQFPYPKHKTYAGNTLNFLYDEILPTVTILGVVLYFAANVSRLVEERVTGLKEYLKMMGVSSQSMWVACWIMTLPVCVLFVIVSTVCMKAGGSALVEKTAWEILAFTMLLHFMYVVFFMFALSSIFRTVKFCNISSAVIWIFMNTLAGYAPNDSKTSWHFVPNVLIKCFFNIMGLYEVQGKGIQWSNIYESPTPETSSVLRLWITLWLQYPLLMIITYYFSNVNPGMYGVAKPLLFCFQNHSNISIFKKKVNPDVSVTEELSADTIVPVDRKYFEESPVGPVGISVQNVTKVFKKLMGNEMKALDNVSLDVLKGEITVLLGHNGAGKTTLMSIITGMYSATEGNVYVNGINTKKDMHKARESMGLCTQHNLTIPYMTVREHVMFFGMLKGLSRSEALAQSSSLLAKVRLTGKEGALAQQLSGGMKRRLQLACAIAGRANVLILDEPTSGLDVETRRELWDLFLSLREGRTVLLTTHFMEEADALGDRVAILMKGSLKCNATAMYLKKMAGTGYRLTLETEAEANEGNITKIIKHDLPSATISSKDPQKLVYSLPTYQANQFPKLFASLEDQQHSLHIKSMGVAVTTLEDVFLNLSSEDAGYKEALSDMRDETFINVPVSEPSYVKMTGCMLILQQIKAIFIKCYLYSKANPLSTLFSQIIVPLLIAFLAVFLTNNQHELESSKVKVSSRRMNVDEFNVSQSIVFYSVNKLMDEQFLDSWMRSYPHLKFVKTDNVSAAILNVGTNNIYEYGNLLMAFEFGPNNVNALYTTNVYHAMPIALNAMTNALYRKYVENTEEDGIITINYPLENHQNDTSEAAQIRRFRAAKDATTKLREPKTLANLYFFGYLLVFGPVGPLSVIVSQSVMDRVSGGRHTQIMSGVRSFTYWFAIWSWNMFTYSFFPFVAVILAYLLDEENTINRVDIMGSLFAVLMVGGAAMMPFFYLYNFVSGTVGSADFKIFFSIMVFGVIIPGIVLIYKFVMSKVIIRTMPVWVQILNVCCMAIPPYNFTMALFTTLNIASKNALCDVGFESSMCSSESIPPDLAMCCNRTSKYFGPNYYFSFNKQSVLFDICLLLINFIFFMIILVLVENGTLSQCWELIWSKFYVRPKTAFNDPDVASENACVRKFIRHPDRHSDCIGLVHKLHKSYRQMFRPVAKAVKGVSFTLKQGECFGLLGVNGAGKSTLFKMLTGETAITYGRVIVNNNDIYKNREKYLWSIGYCPQFSGVCEYLSGREQLMLIARLRGVPSSAINNEVNTMLELLDLKRIADRQIRNYSGGNARRLSAGSAMLCSPPLIILDEPSCGVDVAARRSLWVIIKHQLAAGSTVVISSHSMDETEYLSDRIGIMVEGELAALGTVRHLKQMRAQGYTVKLKIRSLSAEDEVDNAGFASHSESTPMRTTEVDTLKAKMETTLNCQLKDQHPAALVYHVDQTNMTYSSLFAYMEEMKATCPVLEDYSVSETTLEQVFMSYSQKDKS